MRFLFKIHSGHDGFTPRRIPSRLDGKGRLVLGWSRYTEAVHRGDEVWVYFHGQHRFINGVYVKGTVDEVDIATKRVYVRPRDVATAEPLTDEQTSERVAQLVALRYQQVFVVPEQHAPVVGCTLSTTADTCEAHDCGFCDTWQQLPRIDPATLSLPARLPLTIAGYAPAYWVLPPRNFLYTSGRSVSLGVRRTSETFLRFKVGEAALAYPLALGIQQQLLDRGELAFDCIVPIPLSPDKAAAGEIHRTRLLANALAELVNIPVVELLQLAHPISKRRLRVQQGVSAAAFEATYTNTLVVDSSAVDHQTILLIDDVCTEGSTFRAAIGQLRATNPRCEITLATAGQMTVRAAVRDETSLLQ